MDVCEDVCIGTIMRCPKLTALANVFFNISEHADGELPRGPVPTTSYILARIVETFPMAVFGIPSVAPSAFAVGMRRDIF